jgi:hypothetical protein
MNLDNTKRKTYSSCPRRYYWEHIKNLRPMYGSTALRFGLVWHNTLEKYYETIKEQGWEARTEAMTAGALAAKLSWETESKDKMFYDDYRTLENCLSSFISYINNYKDDEDFVEIVEVEKTFNIELGEDIQFVGKVDGKVLLNGSQWLLEHKTSGMPIDKQMKTLQRSPQLLGYAFAGTRTDEVEGILVSMLHLSASKSKTTNSYGKPRIEFRRSPQIFTDGDLNSWLDSFLWTARQVKKSVEDNYFPMQLDSCYTYGQCPFYQLCEQNTPVETTNTQNFITVKHWNVLES